MPITGATIQQSVKRKGIQGNIEYTVSGGYKKIYEINKEDILLPSSSDEVARFIHNGFNGLFEHRELEKFLANELLIALKATYSLNDLLNMSVHLCKNYNEKSFITKDDIRAQVMPLFYIVSESDSRVTLRYKGKIFFKV